MLSFFRLECDGPEIRPAAGPGLGPGINVVPRSDDFQVDATLWVPALAQTVVEGLAIVLVAPESSIGLNAADTLRPE